MAGLFETVYDTCVRGYHVYQEVWVPVMDETLSCCREVGNPHYPFAVKVMKAGMTVGHLPKKSALLVLCLCWMVGQYLAK